MLFRSRRKTQAGITPRTITTPLRIVPTSCWLLKRLLPQRQPLLRLTLTLLPQTLRRLLVPSHLAVQVQFLPVAVLQVVAVEVTVHKAAVHRIAPQPLAQVVQPMVRRRVLVTHRAVDSRITRLLGASQVQYVVSDTPNFYLLTRQQDVSSLVGPTQSASDLTASGSQRTMTGPIVGGIVGGVVIILLAVLIAYCIVRRRRARNALLLPDTRQIEIYRPNVVSVHSEVPLAYEGGE